MPLPVIAGVVRATAAGPIAGGSRWSNTWHFRRIDLGDPDGVSIGVLHVELLAFYVAFLNGNCPQATELSHIDYTPLDDTSGAITLPGDGTGSTDAAGGLPPEVAECLTIRTAGRGRRARGRVYLPAISAAGCIDGHIGAATIAGILLLTTALRAAAVVSGWELGVASYGKSVKTNYTVTPHVHDVTTWAPFFTAANDVTLDNQFDVQRSRKA